MAGLPKSLRKAEQRLLKAAKNGVILSLRVGDPEKDDPANGANWPVSRTIRAEVIYHLLADRPKTLKVHAKGVQLTGARIEGQLDFESARLDRPLWLIACHFEAPIIFRDAKTGPIALEMSHFPGLDGDRVFVDGPLILSEVVSAGEVRLLGAEIGGVLSCGGGRFTNPNGYALKADRATIKGSVFLNENFEAQGGVRLRGVEIGGQLNCIGGSFKNLRGHSLNAGGATIKGDMLLAGRFEASGPKSSAVRLIGLEVGGQLSLRGGVFENLEGFAVNLQSAIISAAIFWNPEAPPVGLVDLRFTRCAVLHDDLERYSDCGDLLIDGFHYDALSPTSDKSSEGRLTWLRKQQRTPGEFPRQPYEHLAKVLRADGRSRDARAISIALKDDLRRSGILSPPARLWNLLIGVTIGHGWAPWKVLPPIAIFFFLGLAFFYGAMASGAMHPTNKSVYDSTPYLKYGKLPTHYPDFNALMYSIDVFIPIVDLRQESYWLPRYSKEHGWIYVIYMWIHIAFGWILTTLGVVGLTGIVKKE